MAGTILGKRTRASSLLDDQPCTRSTRKRVHILEETDKENVSPIKLENDGKDGSMQLDSPTKPSTQPKHASISTAPVEANIYHAAVTETGAPQHKVSTPTSTRFRGALSKQPCTPRHRVTIGNGTLTPRTPRTPNTPSATSRSVYGELRKHFTRGSDCGSVVGRCKERGEVGSFISTRVEARTGGCLYVSGPPGTGKSALVTEVCRAYDGHDGVTYAYVNCMSIRSAADICTLLFSDKCSAALSSGKTLEDALRALFLNKLDKHKSTSYLVVLDEIDALLKLDLSVLYTFFEWAFAPTSRLILVGIANALDLTDRFLPKLKSRNIKPQLLPFLPYTATEIASVLTARCRSILPPNHTEAADFVPVLHPSAIQLISKKVASQTGDLRKSFDIAQRVIDLIETETKERLAQACQTLAEPSTPTRSPLSDNPNLSTPSPRKPQVTTTFSTLTATSAPRATLAHVVRITSQAFNNGIPARLKALNLQQKAVLCAMSALEARNRCSTAAETLSPPQTPTKSLGRTGKAGIAPTVRALVAAYGALCKRDNVIQPLSGSDFRDVVGSLEMASLVVWVDGPGSGARAAATSGRRGKGAAFGACGEHRRISSYVGEKELRSAIEGPGAGVLMGMLDGQGLDCL